MVLKINATDSDWPDYIFNLASLFFEFSYGVRSYGRVLWDASNSEIFVSANTVVPSA